MSATPPPPPDGAPPPEDGDDSLEVIDNLSGREKFKALQKKLSTSNTMYSSSVSSQSAMSPSPPQTASPAPPPKRPHVDEEKEASKNAKKLVHATKDRPRRKVRLPSREMRRESLDKLEPPARPPLPSEGGSDDEEEGVLDLPPPPPPPDSAPPPPPDSAPPPPPDSTPPQTSTPLSTSGTYFSAHTSEQGNLLNTKVSRVIVHAVN